MNVSKTVFGTGSFSDRAGGACSACAGTSVLGMFASDTDAPAGSGFGSSEQGSGCGSARGSGGLFR